MLSQPMNNLQINTGQNQAPQSLAPGITPGMPGVRPRQPSMAPPTGPMLGKIGSSQQLPPQQFTPRMATGIPPTSRTLGQPPFPGQGAPSQTLPNGKLISVYFCVQYMV